MSMFDKEQETYNKELPKLKSKEGSFILIKGTQVVGIYDTYDDALRVGYTEFETEPFFVKQIHAVERIQMLTRHFDVPKVSCPT